MDANAPNAPRKVKAADRQRQALQYRLGGLTFEAIGQKLGISTQAAYKAVQMAMAKTANETAASADELRKVELRRLDVAQAAIWGDMLKGDAQAVAALLKIMDRRSKYLGLDAPVKSDVKVTEGDLDSAIAAELARLAAERQNADVEEAANDERQEDAAGLDA